MTAIFKGEGSGMSINPEVLRADAEHTVLARKLLGSEISVNEAIFGSDKREAQRVKVDYGLEFQVAGRDNFGVGRALDHSETGMQFLTDRPLELGSYVTMRVPLRSEKVPMLTCLAHVVRCLTLPDGSGYAVGCAYD